MKATILVAVPAVWVCFCLSACERSGKDGTQGSPSRPDMGIHVGMTTEQVEAKLGKPNRVDSTVTPTDAASPSGTLYGYDKPPYGVFRVGFDKNGVVTGTGWIDR